MTTIDLIAEAKSLPVEERALIVESLIKSLNSENAEITNQWLELAKKRLHEMRMGLVNPIPANIVFDKVWARFK